MCVYWIAHNNHAAIRPCHSGYSMPLALALPRGGSVILDTKTGPVQGLEGGGDVTYLSPIWEGTARKYPLPETYLTNPWSNAIDSRQACRPCRGSCSLIPGRGCFGDLPGDEIVVSPPSPIVEPITGWCAVITFSPTNRLGTNRACFPIPAAA